MRLVLSFCTLLTTTALMFALSVSAATEVINCSNVSKSQWDIKGLEEQALQAKQRLLTLKSELKNIPNDEDVTSAEKYVEQLKDNISKLSKIVADTKPGLEKDSVPEESDQVKKLDQKIAELKLKITALDEQLKPLQKQAELDKAAKQKAIDDFRAQSTDPQIANVHSIMPSSNLPNYNSDSLKEWVARQIERTDEMVRVSRSGVKIAVPFKDLRAKELLNYDLITSADVNSAKVALQAIFDRRAELKKKKREGGLSDEEMRELVQRVPGKLFNQRNKLYQVFERDFTELLSDLRDLQADADKLKTLEVALAEQVESDSQAISKIADQKPSLQVQMKNIEQMRIEMIDELKAQAKAALDAHKKAEQELAKKKAEVADWQNRIEAMLKTQETLRKAQEKQQEKENAFERAKSELAKFEIDRTYSEKKAMRAAYQKANIAQEQFKANQVFLQEKFASFYEQLEQKQQALYAKARELDQSNKYNEQARQALIKEWDAYKKDFVKRAMPEKEQAIKVAQGAATQMQEAAKLLDDYNCNQFPKAQSYREKLLKFNQDFLQQSKTLMPNFSNASLDLPKLPNNQS